MTASSCRLSEKISIFAMLLIFCWDGYPPTARHCRNGSDDGNAEASSLTRFQVVEGLIVVASFADGIGKLETIGESHDVLNVR